MRWNHVMMELEDLNRDTSVEGVVFGNIRFKKRFEEE
jgi:hypothetical protein